jgi:15-cis-phytoene synthase
MTARNAVRDICRRRAPTLWFASAFVPASKRLAFRTVVAFCAMINDAFDALEGDACSIDVVNDVADRLQERVDAIYSGAIELPQPQFCDASQHVLGEMQGVVKRFEIPRQEFENLVAGLSSHLVVKRYATWASLEKQLRAIYGSEAMALAAVLGLQHSDAPRGIQDVAVAIGLTKSLLNFADEWKQNRLFLPLEDLARFRCAEQDLQPGNPSLTDAVRIQIERARALFRRGAESFVWFADDGSRLAASIIALSYASLLGRIERVQCDVFRSGGGLTVTAHLAKLPAAWRLARRTAEQPMIDVFG